MAKMQTKPPTAAQDLAVPSAAPLEQRMAQDPDYAAAGDNLQKLQQSAADLRVELAQAEARPRTISPAVAGLVVGMKEAAHAGPSYDPAELERIRQTLRTTEQAIIVQERVMQAAHRRASLRICGEAGPDHQRHVDRIASAASELIAAVQAEREFRDRLSRCNVEVLPPIEGRAVFPADLIPQLRAYVERATV
jgi:hypothetical protein